MSFTLQIFLVIREKTARSRASFALLLPPFGEIVVYPSLERP